MPYVKGDPRINRKGRPKREYSMAHNMKQILALYPGFFYLALVTFIIVSSVNAVNVSDGLDGLTAGCMIAPAAVFIVLALIIVSTKEVIGVPSNIGWNIGNPCNALLLPALLLDKVESR